MSATTRRIREMSVVVECDIPTGLTLAEYRSSRERAHPATQQRGFAARLLRRRPRISAA
jgi:hypothetical protein